MDRRSFIKALSGGIAISSATGVASADQITYDIHSNAPVALDEYANFVSFFDDTGEGDNNDTWNRAEAYIQQNTILSDQPAPLAEWETVNALSGETETVDPLTPMLDYNGDGLYTTTDLDELLQYNSVVEDWWDHYYLGPAEKIHTVDIAVLVSDEMTSSTRSSINWDAFKPGLEESIRTYVNASWKWARQYGAKIEPIFSWDIQDTFDANQSVREIANDITAAMDTHLDPGAKVPGSDGDPEADVFLYLFDDTERGTYSDIDGRASAIGGDFAVVPINPDKISNLAGNPKPLWQPQIGGLDNSIQTIMHELGHCWGMRHKHGSRYEMPKDETRFRGGPFGDEATQIKTCMLGSYDTSEVSSVHHDVSTEQNVVSTYFFDEFATKQSYLTDELLPNTNYS